jgi:hypothetical protein
MVFGVDIDSFYESMCSYISSARECCAVSVVVFFCDNARVLRLSRMF